MASSSLLLAHTLARRLSKNKISSFPSNISISTLETLYVATCP